MSAVAENATMQYQTIQVKPLGGSLGAEIAGVDLTQPLTDETIAEIRRAWLAHHIVVFREQDLTPQQQCDFAQYFGELDTYPFVKPLDGYPAVIPIIKEPENKMNFGGGCMRSTFPTTAETRCLQTCTWPTTICRAG